jgi:hypothetical protein
MKKPIFALLVVLCVLCAAAGFAESVPAEKTFPLSMEGVDAGELTLRFYEETPNVPYLGINAYMTAIMGSPLTAEASENGVLILKNDRGGELICDVAAGTILAPDWVSVITPQMPVEGVAKSMKDSNCGFVRLADVTYSGEPAPVTFDFARYGVRIYADSDDVYLPISLLSNIMTDIATNHLRFDGKSLSVKRIDLAVTPEDPVLLNETMLARLAGELRPADIINQCYADICFTFDYFFGHPGKAPMDADLGEKGLDRALTDLGKKGLELKADLLSPSLPDYLAAMQKLFMVYLSDGHTVATDISSLSASQAIVSDKKLSAKLTIDTVSDIIRSRSTISQILHMAITPQRKLIWGDDVYREYGSTAIIRLDSFMPDEAAWASFYKGEGDFPQDCLGIVVTGLRKASENAKIKNVLFDLTCNAGGSSDVLITILGLTTGQDYLLGENVLTGQQLRVTFDIDRNFDGVFDEKDKDAVFDFNYGVLTTRQAFSCGNLFPFVMHDGGAVTIGEPSSGGSCCVQMGTDSQGIRWMMSSAQWRLIDEKGSNIELGCPIDIPIEAKSFGLLDKLVNKLGIDENLPVFTAYFDEENLDTLMNTWFHEEAELAPAA